jgi:hypothetical protein
MSRAYRLPDVEMPLPDIAYITPSKINIWRGGRIPGARFTKGQYGRMKQLGIDPDTVETMMVRSVATAREIWAPIGSGRTVYVFECPIIERRRSDIVVIAPYGSLGNVLPNGTISKFQRQ